MGNKVIGNEMVTESHELVVEEGIYPELEDLEDGATFTASVEGTVSKGEDGGLTLNFSLSDIETENAADKELKKMTGQKQAAPVESEDGDEY